MTLQRIYYKDTDAGGVVYHSRYVEFLEVARTETLRKIFPSVFKILKEQKIVLPVLSLNIQYLKPAFYNDLLFIQCDIFYFSPLKINFQYSIYRLGNEKETEKNLIGKATTHHCSIDEEQFKPKRINKEIFNLINEKIYPKLTKN